MSLKPDYERGGVQLYCGDCLEVLPQLEAGSIDAVVTDPPYGLGRWSHTGGNSLRFDRLDFIVGPLTNFRRHNSPEVIFHINDIDQADSFTIR